MIPILLAARLQHGIVLLRNTGHSEHALSLWGRKFTRDQKGQLRFSAFSEQAVSSERASTKAKNAARKRKLRDCMRGGEWRIACKMMEMSRTIRAASSPLNYQHYIVNLFSHLLVFLWVP